MSRSVSLDKRVSRMRVLNLFIISIMFIAFAEAITTFINPVYGLFIHSAIMVSLFVLSYIRMDTMSNLFLSLSLAPIIRIISLSMPFQNFPAYAGYLIVSVPVFLATVTLMRVQNLSFVDTGFSFKKPLTQVGIALTGLPFGIIEFFILRPKPFFSRIYLVEFIPYAIALTLSTGLVEELAFRGVMQHNATRYLGEKKGIAGVATVFAILHIGWLSAFDVLFVFSIGLFFGYLALKTESIIGVSLAHGITNVLLFLLMPLW